MRADRVSMNPSLRLIWGHDGRSKRVCVCVSRCACGSRRHEPLASAFGRREGRSMRVCVDVYVC